MFGLSLSKLITLIGIIIAVWTLFRWFSRVSAARDAAPGRVDANPGRRPERARRREPDPVPVEDLVACAGCGAYVAARGAKGCGRPNCPYPG
ncbi:hypothetical protein STVA_14100 [Allostella vacuolata]|nr:hypothetical protein STVA_14100 [Stella vacuolata]